MPPRYLLLLLFLVVFLVTIIQLEVLSIAFQKLGLSPRGALLLVLGALFGSSINIPVTTIKSTPPPQPPPDIPRWGRIWQPGAPGYPGKTILAINLGGCIISETRSREYLTVDEVARLIYFTDKTGRHRQDTKAL